MRDTQLVGQTGPEELIVGAPPEWIVDDDRALQHGVLEIRAIVRDLVRDAIDQHIVGAGLVHARAAKHRELGMHARATIVDLLDEGRRPRPFATDQDTYILDPVFRHIVSFG
jgi:hypothetical protein